MINFFFKALSLLDKKNKISLQLILLYLIINFFFELLGLGLLIPLFHMIFENENISEKLPVEISNYLESFPYFDSNTIIVLIILFFFIFKGFWSLFFQYNNAKVIKQINFEVSKKYFSGFSDMPYNFYLNFNSAKLIKNTVTDISFFSETLYNFIILINESIIFIGLLFFLLFYDFQITLYCGVFFLIYFLLQNYFAKKIITKIGEDRYVFEEKKIKTLNEFFGNIIQVKLGVLNHYYKKVFNLLTDIITSCNQKIKFINNLPRIVLEFAFIINFFLIFFLFKNDFTKVDSSIITDIAVYFTFFLKILPSVNRVSNANQAITFMLPVIDSLHKKISKFSSRKKIDNNFNKIPLNFKKSILFRNINFKYNKKNKFRLKKEVLILKNKITLFYGKSGSGKTTYLNIISGLIAPKKSLCLVDSKYKKNIDILKSSVVYVPQNINLIDGSIKENIILGYKYSKKDEFFLNDVVTMVNLKKFINSLPNKMNTKIGEKGSRISGGQIQRIAIARALYSKKPVLLFDEFTSALDKKNEVKILNIIKRLSKIKTIVLSSHSDNVKKICDKIYYFN